MLAVISQRLPVFRLEEDGVPAGYGLSSRESIVPLVIVLLPDVPGGRAAASR